MLKVVENPLKDIIENDYCIGCGVCATIESSPYDIKMTDNGTYKAIFNSGSKIDEAQVKSLKAVCPFSNESKNEDEISKELYGGISRINHNTNIGYYLKNYVAYTKKGDFRKNGSSGGMGSWIASKLLEEDMVDAILHVGSADGEEVLFEYKVSLNQASLNEGAKSKYYPIELSKVIQYVLENDLRYAIIGVPCFIKSIRLLSKENEKIAKRIKYTIGLVCGHLKSDYFAKSIGWELGIHPNNLTEINFRKKYADKSANNYGVYVKGEDNNQVLENESLTRNLFTTNWGHGFFKYNACEYCDDVLAETADVTIGDAWLPKYVKDGMGTNVLTIRSKEIYDLVEKYRNELFLEEVSSEEIIISQSSGLKHRREGLSYRLHLKDVKNEWRPQKRITASDNIPVVRKKIYNIRDEIMKKSFDNFQKAIIKDQYDVFVNNMTPIIKENDKLTSTKFHQKVFKRLKKELKLLKIKLDER